MKLRLAGWIVAAAMSGCMQSAAQVAPAEAPAVPISKPIVRDVTDKLEFTGRTSAIESVNIVPRVTGYLVRSPFKEGSEVKADDLLFEIDARPYQAQLDQAQGQVNLYQAQLELAKTTLARDQEISKTPGAVSAQQLDQDKAAVAEAEARVKAFQASTEVYKLNLSFTKVKAPITGQISRAFLTSAPGNLVNQDQTLLATIVSLDPIYVNFDMDEPTLLRVRRAVNEGRIKMPEDGIVHVSMGVQGEDGFPHEGTINFVNNQVNSTTGSISVRGIFPNPKPEKGARLLSPGMFVRVLMPLGEPHRSLLVIDRAIGSDQGLKFVYVVDAENRAQQRRITTGSLQDDGLRVIESGLKADEWVVVGALQQVRARMEIRPEKIAMPTMPRPTIPDSTPPKAPAKAPDQQPAKEKSGSKDQSGSRTPANKKESPSRSVFP